MKRYRATVRASGLWVETIMFAASSAQAHAIFKAIFGTANVPHAPVECH